jgi:N-dimethylarginine dimethylaminohydrolase
MTGHVLLCRPEHFRIAYEINPWMRTTNPADHDNALEEWERLHGHLERLRVRIELIDGGEDVPDMTFVANAGIVIGRRFLPSNFRHAQRQPEKARFIHWYKERGYAIERIEAAYAWEGEGDILDAHGIIVVAHGFRTDSAALDRVERLLGRELLRVELTNPYYYHLDTCFCPLGPGNALYFPPAFTPGSVERLKSHFPELIAVPEHEARRFACNAVVVGDTVILNDGCPETEAALAARGFRTIATPTSEFIKAGGSVKCLVLTFDSFAPEAPGRGPILPTGSG